MMIVVSGMACSSGHWSIARSCLPQYAVAVWAPGRSQSTPQGPKQGRKGQDGGKTGPSLPIWFSTNNRASNRHGPSSFLFNLRTSTTFFDVEVCMYRGPFIVSCGFVLERGGALSDLGCGPWLLTFSLADLLSWPAGAVMVRLREQWARAYYLARGKRFGIRGGSVARRGRKRNGKGPVVLAVGVFPVGQEFFQPEDWRQDPDPS